MLCEECGKRTATVHVEQTVNGKKTVMNLCEECAREKGVLNVFFQEQFSIDNLLSALLGSIQSEVPALGPGETETRCPVCGMSYRDFARYGRLGCSRCYETFDDRLMPLLRRIHGSDRHVGKVASRAKGTSKLEREIESLKRQLSQAVAREAYEEAAVLRDKIRALEKKLGGGAR